MKLSDLQESVKNHSGKFICSQIHKKSVTKSVLFKHMYDPPAVFGEMPEVGKLKEFYETFGNLLLYFDEKSGDAALYIASPDQWDSLHSYFYDWLEDLDEQEKEELLPEWIDECLVIGEIPHSGNYILMPKVGEKAGHVFEFEHDGFEFIELSNNIENYVDKMLNLDSSALSCIASHMRFVDGDPMIQWWIEELNDNKGNIVRTEV